MVSYGLLPATIRAFILVFGSSLIFGESQSLTRYPLPSSKYPKALCLDGTSPYVYVKPGTGTNSKRWVFFLKGGGACTNEAECITRSQSAKLGSSRGWDATMPEIRLVEEVSEFAGYSQAGLLYCDGQTHAGTKSPGDEGSWGLHFAGQFIFEAALRELLESHGLHNGEVFVLTGTSAGGAGTFYNALFAKRLLEAHSIKVAAVPEGIFIYMHAYSHVLYPAIQNQPWGVDYMTESGLNAQSEMYDIAQVARNEDCMAATGNDRIACSDAATYLQYLVDEVPIFIDWNRWDKHPSTVGPILDFQDESERKSTLIAWGDAYQNLMANLTVGNYNISANKASIGMFHPSCFSHANTPANTKINGKKKGDAIGAWFRAMLYKWNLAGGVQEAPSNYQLTSDDWGPQLRCNPDCCDTMCNTYSNGCGSNVATSPSPTCPSKQVLQTQYSEIKTACQKPGIVICGNCDCMTAYMNSAVADDGCTLDEAISILGITSNNLITSARNLIARLRACDTQDPELVDRGATTLTTSAPSSNSGDSVTSTEDVASVSSSNSANLLSSTDASSIISPMMHFPFFLALMFHSPLLSSAFA